MAALNLSFDRGGRAVLSRESGRTTDIVTLSEGLSTGIAARVAVRGADAAWLAAILSVAESLADDLIDHRRQRTETLH